LKMERPNWRLLHPEKRGVRNDKNDRQIDQLVYQLYGLTDDEIALVEGS